MLRTRPFRRSIHDHADSHCFMRVMDGSLQEVLYAWPDSSKHRDQPITQFSKRDLVTDEVTYISGMHNCSSHCTMTFTILTYRLHWTAPHPEHQSHRSSDILTSVQPSHHSLPLVRTTYRSSPLLQCHFLLQKWKSVHKLLNMQCLQLIIRKYRAILLCLYKRLKCLQSIVHQCQMYNRRYYMIYVIWYSQAIAWLQVRGWHSLIFTCAASHTH